MFPSASPPVIGTLHNVEMSLAVSLRIASSKLISYFSGPCLRSRRSRSTRRNLRERIIYYHGLSKHEQTFKYSCTNRGCEHTRGLHTTGSDLLFFCFSLVLVVAFSFTDCLLQDDDGEVELPFICHLERRTSWCHFWLRLVDGPASLRDKIPRSRRVGAISPNVVATKGSRQRIDVSVHKR